jgi:ABC-type uncharacterized transport system substrate-binding protein
MRRREFIAGLGVTAAWPVVAHGQQTMPVVAFINVGTLDTNTRNVAAFHLGLGEIGYREGQNVSVEYYWLDGQNGLIPAFVAELIRRRVAVIAATTSGTIVAQAAKAANATIPIVFIVAGDPVQAGLVASLARPGGNLTGVNMFSANETVTKRLGLLHEFVPNANRVAVLVNPQLPNLMEPTLREVQAGARVIGLQIEVLKASTSREIEEAFTTLVRERIEALFVSADPYFLSRRVQLATLAAVHRIPISFSGRSSRDGGLEDGALMSYGIDLADVFRQVGAYTGRILKGEKPADLPVLQPTKFEFVINLKTARALSIIVPPGILAIATEVIE